MISKLQYISQGNTPEEHLEHIQKACVSGIEWVQLRLKGYTEKQVLETAIKAKEITTHFQTRLIINDYYKIAKEIKADGVHLGKNDVCPLVARKHLEKWQLIGGTANTLQDCENLRTKNVDYIGLGPFRFTKTKDNLSPPLGEKGYVAILSALKTDIPIIAIGGITQNDLLDIMITGVYGIAISGEITRNFNSISTFKTIINGSPTQEQRWEPGENKK